MNKTEELEERIERLEGQVQSLINFLSGRRRENLSATVRFMLDKFGAEFHKYLPMSEVQEVAFTGICSFNNVDKDEVVAKMIPSRANEMTDIHNIWRTMSYADALLVIKYLNAVYRDAHRGKGGSSDDDE